MWPPGPVAVVTGSSLELTPDPGGTTRSAVLAEFDGVEVGVWEIDPGTDEDVEVDEVVVVLSGRATIDVAGQPTVHVGPGDIVRLHAGTATTWTVTERLRKVYVSLGAT
jgi:uncharacterized cupin superfamily protein